MINQSMMGGGSHWHFSGSSAQLEPLFKQHFERPADEASAKDNEAADDQDDGQED